MVKIAIYRSIYRKLPAGAGSTPLGWLMHLLPVKVTQVLASWWVSMLGRDIQSPAPNKVTAFNSVIGPCALVFGYSECGLMVYVFADVVRSSAHR